MPSIWDKYSEDVDDVVAWCDDQYEKNFAQYFQDVRDLKSRLESERRPITDAELEFILTDIALQLFAVSEVLNSFKVRYEVIKLKIQQEKLEGIKQSEASSQEGKRNEAELNSINSQIVSKAYQAVLDRVDREMAYSRELIMSAKKIWSARRDAEGITQPAETTGIDSLPEYDEFKDKQYIAGA